MGEERRASNYEKTRDEMAALFLRYDQEEMIRRFALGHDESYLFLRFAGRDYRIRRNTGRVGWSEDGFRTEQAADFNEVMTIYDVLCYAKPGCCLSHTWVNVGSLGANEGGSLRKGGGFFQGAGSAFEGRAEQLCRACERLGGRQLETGDVGYEINLFPFLPLRVVFWDRDEDFPASLQILVDGNILDYMHFETLMFALSHLLRRLRE